MTLSRTSSVIVFVIAMVLHPLILSAAPADSLKTDAQQALGQLYQSSPDAAQMGKDAKAVLAFPKVVKVGFMLGGSHGEGVLFKNGEAVSYWNTSAGSWGLQAGVQSYGYAMFLMNDKAVDHLERSQGWRPLHRCDRSGPRAADLVGDGEPGCVCGDLRPARTDGGPRRRRQQNLAARQIMRSLDQPIPFAWRGRDGVWHCVTC